MGFNIYKEIPKIKKILEENGFLINIPAEIFGRTLMLHFGMKKATVRTWISYFEENDIIKIVDGKVNFL